MRKKVLASLILFVLIGAVIPQARCSSGEIDATTVVDYVIDGDTFDTTMGERIRLADIDAPESGEPGYSSAKDFLFHAVYGKTVYLDIDDVNGVWKRDPYGRMVCMVYVDYNSTHYRNVNEALLESHYAVISNYQNEFNPYAWTLYISKDSIPEYSSLAFLLLILMTMLVAAVIYKRKSLHA